MADESNRQLGWSIIANPSQTIIDNGTSQAAGSAAAPSSSGWMAEGEYLWWGDGSNITGIYGSTPETGQRFNDRQAMMLSAVYACSRAIAENLASLPPLVYSQGVGSRSVARDSEPWAICHDEPNHEMNSMTFWELSALRLENRGNAFAEIVRDKKDHPIELWPIHNSRVEPWRDKDGGICWRVWLDSIDPRYEKLQSYVIPDRDMLNIVGFGGNAYIAPGTLAMGSEQISYGIESSRFGSKFFKGGARPAGFVEMPGYIDDPDQRAEFRRDINRAHSRENWHEIGILWQGAKWKEMQYSPEQSQFIESLKFSDKRICQLYRVPPAIVQIFDDYKFASVDAMLQSFVMTCLRPIAVRFERAINSKLMKVRNGRRLENAFGSPMIFEFLLDALLRGDAKKQAETLEIKRRNGILNANEWRALDNDPPLPGEQGDLYVVPGGFERLDQMDLTKFPRSNNGGSSNNNNGEKKNTSQSAQPAANYDPLQLAEAIQQSGLLPLKSQVRGSAVEITSIADEVRDEAIERVESVAKTELQRIEKISDDGVKSTKLANLKAKHFERLESALMPAAKIYARSMPVEPVCDIARRMASEACERLFA